MGATGVCPHRAGMESDAPTPLSLDQLRVLHDLSNALTVLATHLAIARGLLAAVDRQHVDGAATACRLAVGLARQLLAVPGAKDTRRAIDVAPVLQRWADLVRPLLGPDVRVTLESERDLPQIIAEPYALDRVLSNVLTNVRDALDGGGHLQLRARQSAGYVVVSIADDGPGLPEDVRARLFEDGSSSKGAGRGFGLANSFRIVTDHGGTLNVEGAPGRGTTLTIYWPRAESL